MQKRVGLVIKLMVSFISVFCYCVQLMSGCFLVCFATYWEVAKNLTSRSFGQANSAFDLSNMVSGGILGYLKFVVVNRLPNSKALDI